MILQETNPTGCYLQTHLERGNVRISRLYVWVMHPNEKSKNYIYFQYLCNAYTTLVTTE